MACYREFLHVLSKMCFKAVKGISVFQHESAFISLDCKLNLECLGISQGEMYHVNVKQNETPKLPRKVKGQWFINWIATEIFRNFYWALDIPDMKSKTVHKIKYSNSLLVFTFTPFSKIANSMQVSHPVPWKCIH